ncbi:DUF3892 domain-containing protein [Amycolatopsis nigrescens]|uniref:DUF3892 domain-containing protein n=1 Tax=Amycolatopsis nigrescens TaxID=381445 RepID=UPI0003727657|nr:DUF3892 domain-containing protein [Amycolatopsis nigrescens]
MAIVITAVRLDGGDRHEHIAHVWWNDPGEDEIRDNPVDQIVAWIEERGGKAYAADPDGTRLPVVVVAEDGPKHLRTEADGRLTDDLLALPRR